MIDRKDLCCRSISSVTNGIQPAPSARRRNMESTCCILSPHLEAACQLLTRQTDALGLRAMWIDVRDKHVVFKSKWTLSPLVLFSCCSAHHETDFECNSRNAKAPIM